MSDQARVAQVEPVAVAPPALHAVRPATAPDEVLRPALASRIGTRRVTLLVAPTGSGKTTLLSQWRPDVDVLWLPLAGAHADPAAFVRALAAAAGLQAATLAPEDALALVVNALDRRGDAALVLDDVQALSGSAAETQLERLVARLPRRTRLVLAGRAAPALPLGALAASERVLRLGPADLALDPAEVDAVVRAVSGADAPAHARALLDRAEGWAAGVYLVAAALGRGGGDALQHIEDYLQEELLTPLPGELREFMLRTSVLPSLDAARCDALLGRDDSHAVLERLEAAAVLFAAGRPVRYHPLLASLLARELRRRPDLEQALRRRAAAAARGSATRHARDPRVASAAASARSATALWLAGRDAQALEAALQVGAESAGTAPAATAAAFAVRSLVLAGRRRRAAALAAARTSVAIAPSVLGLLALGQAQLAAEGPAAARRTLEAGLRLARGAPDLAPRLREALAAVGFPEPPGGPPEQVVEGEELSEAELRVLRALSGPLSQREIGRELYLSVNTIKTHVCAAYRKLGVHSRTAAVARARALNLI